jgi:hypothetical protein
LRQLALFVAAAVVASACGSRAGEAPASASAPRSPSTLPVATSASAPPSEKVVAFPDLDVLVGTVDGDIYTKIAAGKLAGAKTRVCDGYVVRIEPVGPLDLVSCIQGSTFAVYTYDHRSNGVARVPGVDGPAIWTLLGDGILYVTRGSCAPAAVDCATKLVRRDLRTGANTTIDERVGVVTDFRTTDEGPTIWRAKNSVTFVRPDAEAGTYLLHDVTLTRFSPNRLVSGYKGRWLLESEETQTFNSGCCTYVIRLTQTEQRLTPANVENERAITMLGDGRSVAFRPDSDGPNGTMVIYSATGAVERMDRGAFTPFQIVRATPDWIIGFEYAGAPSLTLRAYRVSDGAFASMAGGSISAAAILPAMYIAW